MKDEQTIERIKRRISAEPRYALALYRILEDCQNPVVFAQLASKISAYPEMALKIHEPATLVSWLVDAGALKELEGSPDDMDGEGNEKDPAETIFATTEAGALVLAEREQEHDLDRLLSDESLGATCLRTIDLCSIPRKKKELEQTLAAEGLLDLGQRQVSFYLDKLERAGGIVWQDGWRTTQKGATCRDLAAQSKR